MSRRPMDLCNAPNMIFSATIVTSDLVALKITTVLLTLLAVTLVGNGVFACMTTPAVFYISAITSVWILCLAQWGLFPFKDSVKQAKLECVIYIVGGLAVLVVSILMPIMSDLDYNGAVGNVIAVILGILCTLLYWVISWKIYSDEIRQKTDMSVVTTPRKQKPLYIYVNFSRAPLVILQDRENRNKPNGMIFSATPALPTSTQTLEAGLQPLPSVVVETDVKIPEAPKRSTLKRGKDGGGTLTRQTQSNNQQQPRDSTDVQISIQEQNNKLIFDKVVPAVAQNLEPSGHALASTSKGISIPEVKVFGPDQSQGQSSIPGTSDSQSSRNIEKEQTSESVENVRNQPKSTQAFDTATNSS